MTQSPPATRPNLPTEFIDPGEAFAMMPWTGQDVILQEISMPPKTIAVSVLVPGAAVDHGTFEKDKYRNQRLRLRQDVAIDFAWGIPSTTETKGDTPAVRPTTARTPSPLREHHPQRNLSVHPQSQGQPGIHQGSRTGFKPNRTGIRQPDLTPRHTKNERTHRGPLSCSGIILDYRPTPAISWT